MITILQGDVTMRRAGLEAYLMAKKSIITEGYLEEIEYVRSLRFEELKESKLLEQYLFVMLCWGVREQVARKDWEKLLETLDPMVITCRFKVKKQMAARLAIENFVRWYGELKCAKNPIKYLKTLPLIGKVMALHLARNIGIDCVKPDRHLTRWAMCLGYVSAYDMCRDIQYFMPEPKERLGVIDVVLWRYCNLFGVPV